MIVEDFYSNREPRVYKEYAPTLRSDREGLKVVQQEVKQIDGCSPSLNTVGGGGLEPKIVTFDIPKQVKVRKYYVDTDKLSLLLRQNRKELKLSIECLSEKLNKPKTLVEHWFRTDKCFAVPDADIWFCLKDILHISTNEFDLPITEFEIRDGVFEKGNRVYGDSGIAPTLTSTSKETLVLSKEIMVGDEKNMNVRKETFGTITTDGSSPKHNNRVLIKQATKQGYIECEVGGVFDGSYPDSETRRGRVQENGNIAPTLTADGSENLYRVEKPNERFFQQALETLQNNECEYGDTINAFNKTVDKSGVSPTLTTRPEGFKTAILPVISRYRIRKLTPRECGRLMGVSDEDITKMLEVNSNSQCYKQFGNSIVVPVMEMMFRNLNIKGVSNE